MAVAKRMALELLYEDEYDDSFDELAEVKGVGAAAGSSADDDAIGGAAQKSWISF